MAYNYRGRRVAYDNIAVGSVAGAENTISNSSDVSGNSSDDGFVSLINPPVSPYGATKESGGFSNIANAALPGIEDTDNATADKLTSNHEDVAN